jgi:hypothetical protein
VLAFTAVIGHLGAIKISGIKISAQDGDFKFAAFAGPFFDKILLSHFAPPFCFLKSFLQSWCHGLDKKLKDQNFMNFSVLAHRMKTCVISGTLKKVTKKYTLSSQKDSTGRKIFLSRRSGRTPT